MDTINTMKKWNVEITRTTYDTKRFQVQAETEEEAKNIVEELALDTDWGHSYSAEYEVQYAEAIQ